MTITSAQRFEPGSTAVRRDVFRDKVWTATPRRVIEDSGSALTLAHWPGAEGLAPTTYIDSLRTDSPAAGNRARNQGFADLASGSWELGRWTWRDTTVLSRFAAGEHFSVHLFFDADLRPRNWYVNFELPFRRTAIGIDTCDLFVDLVIAPDLSRYEWKDEDEYAQGRRLGLIDEPLHGRIEEARERALALLEERQGAFAQGWLDWRPAPSWPLPEMPAESTPAKSPA